MFYEQGLTWGEAGQVFTAVVLIFESSDGKRIEVVMNTGCASREVNDQTNVKYLLTSVGIVNYIPQVSINSS
jgi:hypothetical protein